MSKEQDQYVIRKLKERMMPLYMANMMTAYEDELADIREYNRENRQPYKQTRNKDKSLTAKRKAVKQSRKKNRK